MIGPMSEPDIDPEIHRAALALIVAELDGRAAEAAPVMLDRGEAFAIAVAEHLAELLCDHLIDAEDDHTEEIRAELQAELHRLADGE